ncbi:transposase [Streptomyces flaveolus]|uniref:transposase n=1 Tax=Streptomyces flaveolus TaxID=67297 RepID=UPI0033A0F0C9
MSDLPVSVEAVEEVRPAELPADVLDDQLIGQLVDRARASGLQLTKRVLESALEGEITDHLGYENYDPAGAGSGNSRNGARSKTVLTDVGPVEITVPPDRDGSFEPQIVKKRQRRLTGVDEMVLSLSARELTHGDISAHLAEVYGASVSKQTISTITVRWPKAPKERRDAWSLETALRVRDVMSPRNRIAVVLGLGCGLRQGEVFGLSPEDIDYARGVPHIRRQVQAIYGRLYFALPKGAKTRTVDMPSSVAEELKRHVEAFPPVEVELPWGKPEADGQRRKFFLLLTTRFGNAVAVTTWNAYTWKPALAKAGIIPPRWKGAKKWQWEAAPRDGFRVLRHTYASIMLEAGESVVTLARWLGHSSPAVTLGYYAHFMSEAGSKGRTAIDGLLGRQGDEGASRTPQILPRADRGLSPGLQRLGGGHGMQW